MIKELDHKEIELLIAKVQQKVHEDIIIANRTGDLEQLLKRYNFIEEQEKWYSYPNTSKMIIIGDGKVKKENVFGCLKELNFDKRRVEFYDDYKKLKNINFGFLRNNCKYSDILICGIPHKMAGIGDNASLISMIEKNPKEYPTLTRIMVESGALKYSISALKKALMKTNMFKEINGEEYSYI